jgi:hypothetical protein
MSWFLLGFSGRWGPGWLFQPCLGRLNPCGFDHEMPVVSGRLAWTRRCSDVSPQTYGSSARDEELLMNFSHSTASPVFKTSATTYHMGPFPGIASMNFASGVVSYNRRYNNFQLVPRIVVPQVQVFRTLQKSPTEHTWARFPPGQHRTLSFRQFRTHGSHACHNLLKDERSGASALFLPNFFPC